MLSAPSVSENKYDRGHAIVVSGPAFATGASRLAAQAALVVGSGLVSIIGDEAALTEHAAYVTAIMLKRKDASFSLIDHRVRSIVAGPAMGVGADTIDVVSALLAREIPIVLDADALTSFAASPARLFAMLQANAVLTPHDGEIARLFPGINLCDRISAAQTSAKQSGAIVLLKGA